MSPTDDEISNRKKINEIVEVADEALNDWEREFIEKLNDFDDDQLADLTDKQQAKLDQIYEKVCDSPF